MNRSSFGRWGWPSGEQGDRAPDRHQHSDDDQKRNPARPILGLFHSLGGLSSAMLPPGEAVAQEQGETETEDQFREQVFDVEEVAHFAQR